VDFARTYAELLKTRFEDSVLFTFNIAAEAENRYVVPLSLQLLLENCIKHNFATAQKPLDITIKTEKETLIVENTLQPRPVISDREGIGLANIVQRYALLTKAEVIVEETPETFAVHIPLLHQKQNIMNATERTQDEAYRKAARRVRELKSFYSNLISYCLVIPFLIFVNLMTSREYYWFWWPMLGWGLGLSFHAMQTFGVGRNWEEKQIEKILNQNKK
ncbi:MAG TPA: histidine kinase, partial [Chryseobacterium sp.]|nr:histidine kinase [Chryseobacterium sp.]